jgi:cold-inducible RNA-binding protein
MEKKLYVGNLPYSVSEQQIKDLFSQVGEVGTVSLITDRETGRAKGFGFVEMVTEEGAAAAIEKFNGYDMDGRALTVNEARPREERPQGGFGGGNRGGFRGGNNRGGGFGGGNRYDRAA